MRKYTLLVLIYITLTACKNNTEIETVQNLTENPEMSKSESDQKIIEVCENMDGIVDTDIKNEILTVRTDISKIEAQKLSN